LESLGEALVVGLPVGEGVVKAEAVDPQGGEHRRAVEEGGVVDGQGNLWPWVKLSIEPVGHRKGMMGTEAAEL
jgi:hypothetical protein